MFDNLARLLEQKRKEDLQLKIRDSYLIEDQQRSFIEVCKGIPFFRWDLDFKAHEALAIKTANRCCFNHLLPVGLPVKNGTRHPLYDINKS